MRFSLPSLAGAAALALALAGSAGGPRQAIAAEPEIVVYNAQHANLTQAWVDAFTRETGIKVTVRKGSDLDMANQIVLEGAASPADVFLTENSPAMMLVDSAGLFAPLDADTLALVPAAFRPADGRWTGIAARTTVFAYNPTRLNEAELPKSMLDLADPKWKGRWGAAPAGADFQAIVSALLQLKGEEATLAWLKAMKAGVTPFRGNSVAMKAVNDGQVDGAVIYHYYYFGDQAKTGENSKNVALHYFRNQDPGAFVSISGGGVLAASEHPKEAQAFVRWIVGKGGQAILRDGDSFEYAVAEGADSNPRLEPLAKLQAPTVEVAKLNSKKVSELMTKAGLI